jgi:hypothetical protein
MHFLSLFSVTGLLVASVASLAVPSHPSNELEFANQLPKRTLAALAAADHSDERSCNLTSPNLRARDLRHGTWTEEDVPYLDAEVKKNAHMPTLLELHRWTAKKLGGIPRALQGGLMYRIRLHDRKTSDVDLVVQTDMPTLISLFKSDRRFYFPTWKPSNVLRLYVDMNDNLKCPFWMELDLILSGKSLKLCTKASTTNGLRNAGHAS